MLKRLIAAIGLILLASAGQSEEQDWPVQSRSTIIVNARMADGTGAPLRRVNVRIVADRIARIGNFQPQDNERVIEADGLVLAPGFIDIHNHSAEGLEAHPLAITQIAQGITTVILGADGGSPWPIGPWLEARRRQPAALNIALLVGHGTVRKQVMGEDYDRIARPAEVERMAQRVEKAMRAGAIGLSSGLGYDIGSYSTTDEVIALARAAARHGGFYMTHIRNEQDRSFEALREAIAIGEKAAIPVQHSHIKLASAAVRGKAPEHIRMIEAARARGVDYLVDCYPYDAWYSTIEILVSNGQHEDPRSVAEALADTGGASRVTIVEFAPNLSYENRTLEELARSAGISPIEMYIRIIREGKLAGTEARAVVQAMSEADIEAFYRQPWVMVASDGGIGSSHPRGAGTFPRVLGRYVRERQWLTLPEAIRKMTSLPARRLDWADRGTIHEGAFADLVLFDPDTVIDRATFAEPTKLPAGIETVFVNGVIVWNDNAPTGLRPGRVLPRPDGE